MDFADKNFESEFYFKSSRSGGKGGQNVNKVETKIELNFDVTGSNLLNDEEKERILIKIKNRIDKNGVLRIVSQTERSQYLNKQISIKKFYELLRKAFVKEKIRKKTKPSKSDKENRLSSKKIVSKRKEMRKVKLRDLD